MPAAHDCVRPQFPEDCRDPPAVRVQLHGRPGVDVRAGRLTGVLGFDPDETAVACGDALPVAGSRVVRAAGSDDEECAVPSKAQLRQRTGQIRPSSRHDPEAGHVSLFRSSRVMAHHAADGSDVATSARTPAGLFSDFEAGIQQDGRQPRK